MKIFRLNSTLRTKILASVSFILLVQVVFILWVVQNREVRAILEEQLSKGILLTRIIAQENLQAFVQWDEPGVRENIEERLLEGDNLLYVIFYDRFNRVFVGNDFITKFEEIYRYSNLSLDSGPDDYYSMRRRLETGPRGATQEVLEIEVPVFMRGASSIMWGSIKIGLSLEDIRSDIQETRLLLILIGLGGLVLGMLGVTWLSKRITTPIKKLVDGTVRISRGDFNHSIEISSQDEIGNLARSFNEMSRQLQLFENRMEEANKRLVQVEKLASIGHISAGIAHEIRNPLTSVKLNIQKLMSGEELDDITRAHLEISQEGIAQIEKFIKQLLNFARVSQLHIDEFSVEQIIHGSIIMISGQMELKKIRLKTEYAQGLPLIRVDADKLRQVILNILRNACETVDEGGRIRIRVTPKSDLKPVPGVRIEISDNGPGIPEKDLKDIFEPFYTTKPQGVGLGLAIALKIVEQHKGVIEVLSGKNGGTTFMIDLPARGEI